MTFSNIRKRLITKLLQYIRRPTPTRHIKASWLSQRISPTLPSNVGRFLAGRGSSLYQEVADGEAHGTREVKKLSKHRERAADQAHIKSTSNSVCASFPEVRHKPRGRPKYSRYTAVKTCTSVNGAKIITRVGELPRAPMMPYSRSRCRTLIATPRAAVVNVRLIKRKSCR